MTVFKGSARDIASAARGCLLLDPGGCAGEEAGAEDVGDRL
jgi:hypothetical protein